MILTSFAEVVSIGAVLPFLGVLMAPEMVFSNKYLQPFFELLHITDPQRLIAPLTASFIFAASLSGAMRLLLLKTQTHIGYSIGADLGSEIYRRTLYQPYRIHVARNSSEIISGIISKTASVIGNTVIPILTIGSSGIILIAILAGIILVNPPLALKSLAGVACLYGAILLKTKKQLAIHGERISTESDRVVKALQEGLGGIRDVLIEGTQEVYCQTFQKSDAKLRRSQATVQVIIGSPRFLVETTGICVLAALAFITSKQQAGVFGSIPILGAIALGAQRLLPVLQQIYAGWANVRAGESSLRDVVELLDQPLPNQLPRQSSEIISFSNSVKLEQVGFRYSESSPWILRNVSLEIKKGSRVGLIGITGSGKSTLLDILMGLLAPTEGRILIDSTKLTEENSGSWQEHISHVPQAIFLSDATIIENIAFGVPRASIDIERIRTSVRQAQMEKSVQEMPRKYETMVGERGVRLSGGQRQRVGIARALYKGAEFIILDEATSALDETTEDTVMRTIKNVSAEGTILIVSHRMSTLRGCDVIYKIVDGAVSRLQPDFDFSE